MILKYRVVQCYGADLIICWPEIDSKAPLIYQVLLHKNIRDAYSDSMGNTV